MNTRHTQAQRVVFSGKQEVDLESFEVPPPGPEEILIKTTLSLMSTGTENIIFNRLFDPGTHFDEWVKYPFYPGYSSVGRVQEVGSLVEGFSPGDHVAFRVGHRSHATLKATACVKIPEELADEEAVWFAVAKIGFHGARAAAYRIGDSVLIIGAGPIGQVSIRWAAAAGAKSIVVVDAFEQRMDFALAGGASAVISSPIEQSRAKILALSGGELPRVVVDSTGNAAVFSAALGLVSDFGTVVLLGDTGTPAKQSLTPDVITRGLTIVGAHDNHTTAEWNSHTIPDLFFRLAATGRFNVQGLNTHIFRPEACAEAYQTANRERAKTMGIVFDWR